MTQREWIYRVGFEFTGGPTRAPEQPAWEPDRWTGDGNSSCDVKRNAPLTEDDWPALAVDLARHHGFGTVTVTSAVEVSEADAR